MPPALLLSIPRELRDNIYKYLYHPVRLEWLWYNGERCESSEAQLDNAPLLDVLLINHQIYNEYYEASLRTLSATIDWCYDVHSLPPEIVPILPAPRFDFPFLQLRRVTLLLTNTFYAPDPYYGTHRLDTWGKTRFLAEMLHEKAPYLATLRIIFCDEIDAARSENDILRGRYPYTDRTGDEEFRDIESILVTQPKSLAGLPFTHHGHGHYVESTCKEHVGIPAEWEATPRLDWGIHAVCRVAQYIYTHMTHTTFTAPTEFWDAWDGPTRYPDGLLQDFEEVDVKRIRGRERKMLEWKEEDPEMALETRIAAMRIE